MCNNGHGTVLAPVKNSTACAARVTPLYLEPFDSDTSKDGTGSQRHFTKCTFSNPPQNLDLVLQ